MELKNVNERDDMGAKLYVTPQAALMIATYDGEGNADVMMAAWGGQQEGNPDGFQPGSHKTTENIRLNKVFFTPSALPMPARWPRATTLASPAAAT